MGIRFTQIKRIIELTKIIKTTQLFNPSKLNILILKPRLNLGIKFKRFNKEKIKTAYYLNAIFKLSPK